MPFDTTANPSFETMIRPRLLVQTAKIGARLYKRERDLPGAVPGLLAQPEHRIMPRLIEAELKCEQDRRLRAAQYRPARHLQILSALLAEALVQAKASGSAALRSTTNACNASSTAGSMLGA